MSEGKYQIFNKDLIYSQPNRTIMREHIPKRHLDFDNAPKPTKAFDNTSDRIYGEKNP